jgi:hypothetical protein
MSSFSPAKKPKKYDVYALSEDEKTRFASALGDGFGYSPRAHRNQRLDELALPDEVSPGLLKHRAYYAKTSQSDFLGEDQRDEFWAESDGDSPPGLFEQCPVNFHYPEIRAYFLEQKAAYIRFAKSTDDYEWMEKLSPDQKTEREDGYVYGLALRQTYSKAWYEYHINSYIFYIDDAATRILKSPREINMINMCVMLTMNFSATLGRLVEQYYWKFLLEKAAIRGEKIAEAARSGGDLRASKQKGVHAVWQSAASAVWREHPNSAKTTVASIVKKRLGLSHSAKHISRVITRP